jgi:CRP/FNR family nitrogen fixation transcriptional regulator
MVMLTAIAATVQVQPASKTVSTDAFPSVAKLGAPVPYTRDAEIYGEGEEAEYVYQVVSGAVRTYKILNDGRRQIGAFYLAGDVFGLEAGDEHEMSAEAVCSCTVSVLKRTSLTSLAGRDSNIASALLNVTARELQRAQKHMLLLVRTAQERVASFLLEMADRTAAVGSVELPMPRKDIADYLGLTIETVSRIFTRLKDKGVIRLLNLRSIEILKHDALRYMSE